MFNMNELAIATWQTLYMVFIASFIGIVFGLMLGCITFATGKHQALENKWLHRVLGLMINITRSTPFIILMICLIPLTHALIGTTIGTNAAIVPLSIAAIPFFARICENALADVPAGLFEAGHAMGVSNWQLLIKILLPESLPALIRGATLTIIGLIGYSAMAGVVGGGGLGELAINYGYQRFDIAVMIETVVTLILLVQMIQFAGDYLAKAKRIRIVGYLSSLFCLIALGVQCWPLAVISKETLRVGVMSGWSETVMQTAKQVAATKYHLQIDIVPFTDYVQPNVALVNKSIDANIFQHAPYLDAQIKEHHYPLTAIAKTFVYPMGFYSQKYRSLNELPLNATIALPNDPSNEARALLLLQQAGLIRLKANAGTLASIADIVENNKHVQFTTLDAAQLPRALNDVAMAAVTNDYIGPAGLNIADALVKEDSHSAYANVIVARGKDAKSNALQELVLAMHSPEVIAETDKLFPSGAAVKAW